MFLQNLGKGIANVKNFYSEPTIENAFENILYYLELNEANSNSNRKYTNHFIYLVAFLIKNQDINITEQQFTSHITSNSQIPFPSATLGSNVYLKSFDFIKINFNALKEKAENIKTIINYKQSDYHKYLSEELAKTLDDAPYLETDDPVTSYSEAIPSSSSSSTSQPNTSKPAASPHEPNQQQNIRRFKGGKNRFAQVNAKTFAKPTGGTFSKSDLKSLPVMTEISGSPKEITIQESLLLLAKAREILGEQIQRQPFFSEFEKEIYTATKTFLETQFQSLNGSSVPPASQASKTELLNLPHEIQKNLTTIKEDMTAAQIINLNRILQTMEMEDTINFIQILVGTPKAEKERFIAETQTERLRNKTPGKSINIPVNHYPSLSELYNKNKENAHRVYGEFIQEKINTKAQKEADADTEKTHQLFAQMDIDYLNTSFNTTYFKSLQTLLDEAIKIDSSKKSVNQLYPALIDFLKKNQQEKYKTFSQDDSIFLFSILNNYLNEFVESAERPQYLKAATEVATFLPRLDAFFQFTADEFLNLANGNMNIPCFISLKMENTKVKDVLNAIMKIIINYTAIAAKILPSILEYDLVLLPERKEPTLDLIKGKSILVKKKNEHFYAYWKQNSQLKERQLSLSLAESGIYGISDKSLQDGLNALLLQTEKSGSSNQHKDSQFFNGIVSSLCDCPSSKKRVQNILANLQYHFTRPQRLLDIITQLREQYAKLDNDKVLCKLSISQLDEVIQRLQKHNLITDSIQTAQESVYKIDARLKTLNDRKITNSGFLGDKNELRKIEKEIALLDELKKALNSCFILKAYKPDQAIDYESILTTVLSLKAKFTAESEISPASKIILEDVTKYYQEKFEKFHDKMNIKSAALTTTNTKR